jgi:DNA-binding Xre family transcriptional regulator
VTGRRLRVQLRECLDVYERRTGRRPTYAELAAKTGLSEDTIRSVASRAEYNVTLRTIERLCTALDVDPSELLVWK